MVPLPAGGEDDDTFVGRSTLAKIFGTGFDITANNFPRIDAYAQGGSDNRAYLYDSSGNDVFTGGAKFSYLFGTDFANYARGFERVDAYATSGTDKTNFNDSSGDDDYVGRSTKGVLSGSGFLSAAHNFAMYDAFFEQNGTDLAKLFDSVGNDKYHSQDDIGVLAGSGFRHSIRNNIEAIQVFGGAGGTDTVEATVIKDLDTVFGSGNLFRLNRNNSRDEDITDFQTVNATAEDGHTPVANVGAVDYVFNQFETWTP